MDERLLDLYEIELRHLQGLMAEFRRSHEKVSSRLMISEDGRCLDPWVQRLLEGSAFLAARVHQRLDDEFPRFTQGLIETVYPDFLYPIPSMGIFEFQPRRSVPDLMGGKEVERRTAIRNAPDSQGPPVPVVEFRTAHSLRLFSLSLAEVQYVNRGLDTLRLPAALGASARSALRLRLTNEAPAPVAKVGVDSLDVFVSAEGEARSHLLELLLAHTCGLCVRDPDHMERQGTEVASPQVVQHLGFDASSALLPPDPRMFSGYRLLREYFTLPDRLAFFRLSEFAPGLGRCEGRAADLYLLFRKDIPVLNRLIGSNALKLYCTPAINLFPMSLERLLLDHTTSEIHLLADRFRALDFEIFRVEKVEGIGDRGQRQVFAPFFRATDGAIQRDGLHGEAFYTVRRVRRGPTHREQQQGAMRSYGGTEAFLSLVDSLCAPYSTDLRQLAVECLCSNRHLPLEVPSEVWENALVASPSPPYLDKVRLVGSISEPQMPETEGQSAWEFVSHLGLNLHHLETHESPEAAAAWLQGLLRLHAPRHAVSAHQHINGLREVRVRPALRRVEGRIPPGFAHGLEVTLEVDETAFRGHSAHLFGATVACFLSRHVALNSFAETVLWSQQRQQEIMRWPAHPGSPTTT